MPRWVYGKHSVLERLKQDVHGLEYVVIAKGLKRSDSDEISRAAQAAGLRVQFKDRKWVDDKVGHDKHQGVAASAGDFRYAELVDIIEAAGPQSTVLALDGVEDPGNLGAILRSAECLGASGVIIPKDRAAEVTGTAEKASAGAAALIPVAQVVNMSRALDDLKKAGFWVYGLAGQAKESLYGQKFNGKVCLVLGGESDGIRDLVTKHCDVLMKVPMPGKTESLNVSVAAGIALAELLRQRKG